MDITITFTNEPVGPPEKTVTEHGELVIMRDDGVSCWILTLSHDLLGSVDFGLSALEELHTQLDHKIRVLRGEIPDTDALAESAGEHLADWWTGGAK